MIFDILLYIVVSILVIYIFHNINSYLIKIWTVPKKINIKKDNYDINKEILEVISKNEIIKNKNELNENDVIELETLINTNLNSKNDETCRKI